MTTKNFQPQLQHFEQMCKDAGLKVTHQRLEIYRELLGALDHPSAETLYKRSGKTLAGPVARHGLPDAGHL